MMKSKLHAGLLAVLLLPSSALLSLLASSSYPPAFAPPANQLIKRQTPSPLGGVLDSLTKSPSSKPSDSKSDSSLADPSGPPPSSSTLTSPSPSPSPSSSSPSSHDSTSPTPVSLDPSPAISSLLPLPSPASPSSETSKTPTTSASNNASSAPALPVPTKDSKDSKNSTEVPITKSSTPKGSSSASSPSNNSTATPSEPANTSPLPVNPTKPPPRKSSEDSSSSIGATTLKTMGIIAGCVAGVYLLWTIIRKWKFSPSKRFANKLDDYDDQVFEPRPPSFRENRPNAYYTPYQSAPSHAPSPYGAKYPPYMQEERLAGLHRPESLDGSEHQAVYGYGNEHNGYTARLSNSSLTTPSAVFESNHHRLSTAGLGNIQPNNTHPYAYPPDHSHTHVI